MHLNNSADFFFKIGFLYFNRSLLKDHSGSVVPVKELLTDGLTNFKNILNRAADNLFK